MFYKINFLLDIGWNGDYVMFCIITIFKDIAYLSTYELQFCKLFIPSC